MFELVPLGTAAVPLIPGRRFGALTHKLPLFDVVPPTAHPLRAGVPAPRRGEPTARRQLAARLQRVRQQSWRSRTLGLRFRCCLLPLDRRSPSAPRGEKLRPALGCATPPSKSNPKPPCSATPLLAWEPGQFVAANLP